MGAEKTWTCFQTYRTDAARDVEKLFGNDLQKILAALKTYPKNNDYKGHHSQIGTADAGENASLKKDLDDLQKFLNKKGKALEDEDDEPKKKGPDPVKKANNQKTIATFTKLISDAEDAAQTSGKPVKLAALKKALDDEAEESSTNWQEIKNVWNEYARVYTAAKGKKPTKD